MRLTTEQLREFEERGYVLIPACFSRREITAVKAVLPPLLAEHSPARIVESDRANVRSIYGSHTRNEILARLARHPRLVEPAMQVLEGQVYVYQFKINIKAAFGGDVWEWHQDYIFWRNEDGVPSDRITNVAVFLDDVNEFNAPLMVIPGSHAEGVIEVAGRESASPEDDGEVSGPTGRRWISNVTARLKYSLDRETVAGLAERHGLESIKGPAGSLLLFHCNLAHASTINMSPCDRAMAFVTFNSLDNLPAPVARPRPEFLASREHRPTVCIADNALLGQPSL